MQALKRPSVIVLDNASYHNIKIEENAVTNFNQRKAVLQDYLSKHNIPFQHLETKKQLYSYPIIVYFMSNFSEFISRKDRSLSNYFRKIEIARSN
jgi:hypothetical protein